MQRVWKVSMLMAVLCAMLLCAFSAQGETAGEQDAWTVMFYMCGSDLESRYSYGTETLKEIAGCVAPAGALQDGAGATVDSGAADGSGAAERPGKVNVVVATGGASAWHCGELGMDVQTDRIQYWRFVPQRIGQTPAAGEAPEPFPLEAEQPLQSMADPGTLTDFIQWAAATCPAEKYCLVLWDHGGGSKTGIFIDELFAGDIMYLDELRDCLAAAGVQFETVLLDACMMGNVETAWAIHENAKWMTASEELVAGMGTAVGDWLQQLYYVPECDGKMLGRWICDMTQIRCASNESGETRNLMTWSVTDLSRIGDVVDSFDAFFATMGDAYAHNPELLAGYAKTIFRSEMYGTGEENMFDLSGMMYDPIFAAEEENNIHGIHRRMMQAIGDAVAYSLRGSGRAAARGLSFCYVADFSPEELEIYSRNCPSAHYLALMDALSPWDAPDWVFETAEKLPESSTLEEYRIRIEKFLWEDGTPAFRIPAENTTCLGTVVYNLYMRSGKTGDLIGLGTAPAYVDRGAGAYRCYGLQLWPAIDGELCDVVMQTIPRDGNYDTLFNIPIQINGVNWNLRCAYLMKTDSYEVYGLWEGYNSDNAMFNRNVKSLSQMAGQEYQLLYPVDTADGSEVYEFGERKTMYRAVDVAEVTLPEGEYVLEYVVFDVFMRPMATERVTMQWDGQQFQTAPDAWGGEEILENRPGEITLQLE